MTLSTLSFTWLLAVLLKICNLGKLCSDRMLSLTWMENILYHDERFSVPGKMKTEKLCKMLMSGLTIPFDGIMVTDFRYLKRVLWYCWDQGLLIHEKIFCLQSIFNINSCLRLHMANSVTNKWVIRQNINCHISMIPFFDWRTLSCFTVNMKFFFSFLCPFSPVLKLFSDQKSLFSFSGFVCFFTGTHQFMWQLSERLCNCFSACAICFWVWISISTATCSCLEYSQFCQWTRYF